MDDTFAEEAVEISLVITALSQEDQIAAIDKDTGEFQVEGILAKFDDPSGAAPDVAIITPTHTFECHMSKLVSVLFFKEVQDAAQTEDPSPPQPVHYQFVVVGGETWSIQPLANHVRIGGRPNVVTITSMLMLVPYSPPMIPEPGILSTK